MDILRIIYQRLMNSQELKNFINLITAISQKYKEIDPLIFSTSVQHDFIDREMKKLRFPEIEQLFNKLPPIPNITAIILKTSKFLTLAFIMMPQKGIFNWHDHANMNGFTKAVCGEIYIESIDTQYIKKDQTFEDLYIYPRKFLRQEKIDSKSGNISLIYPTSYNIHKIKSKGGQGAFLDLLIPQYPDNSCNHFEQIGEDQYKQYFSLRKTDKVSDEVIGFEHLFQYLKKNEKK